MRNYHSFSSQCLGAIGAVVLFGSASLACSNSATDGSGGTGAGGSATTSSGGGGTSAMKTVAVDETSLVSDLAGAKTRDADLVNAWGIAFDPDEQPGFWIANNHTGLSTIYDMNGKKASLVVKIPAVGDEKISAPTGQVYNHSAKFNGDKFIFDGEDGTITGWQSGTSAVVRANQSSAGAIYKGLAIAVTGTPMLYATDFHGGKVDVFDGDYRPLKNQMKSGAAFTDAKMPAGFAPFNVAVIENQVYVSYAKQDDMKEDDTKGAGNGFVDVFERDGTFVKRLISGGVLNSPWGLAMAPAGFGEFAGKLLVGNFGDGAVHAFDLQTGALAGSLTDTTGKPIVIQGLWALAFGPSSATPDLSMQLFFTAGPGDEEHGRFGKLALSTK